MNEPFVPPSADSLNLLLKFLGDPKDAAKHIGEMKKVAESIEKSRKALKKERDEHLAAQNAADVQHSARQQELTDRENQLRRLDGYSAELAARERAVREKEHELSGRMTDHVQREDALKNKEAAFGYRETELRNSQVAVDARAKKLAGDEADYKERIARLRLLAG